MKHLKYILPILLFGIALSANAQVASPNYFRKVGSNIYPIGASSTNVLGTSTYSGAFNNLTVSGTCTGCGSGGGGATTTINGVTGPTFTFSIVGTTSASSITTNTAQLFLNLLKYTSGTNVSVSSNGVINFVDPGYVLNGTGTSPLFNNVNASGTINASTSITVKGTAVSTSTGANPTASIGTSAVNGSASTFMRSDGAPAINQAAAFSFSALGNTTSTGNIGANSFSTFNTSTVSIVMDFDNTLYVPWNYTTSTYGDFGQYVMNWYNQQSSTASSVLVMMPAGLRLASASWRTAINFNNNGERASIRGVPGGGSEINWGGSGVGITVNNGNGAVGVSHMFGSTIDGMLIDCGATSTSATTTAIKVGGNQGAEGFVLQNNNIRHCGVGLETSSNTWQFKALLNNINGNVQNLVMDTASNSGETMVFAFNDFFDPIGTSTTAAACAMINTNQASVFFNNNSFDDCGVTVAPGNLNINFTQNHFENPAASSTYGGYYYITIQTSTFTTVTASNNTFMNDSPTASTSPGAGVAFINDGGNININGGAVDTNGSATTTASLVTNTIAPSSAVISVCSVTNVNGTGVNFFINGVQSVNYQYPGCLYSTLGSWTMGYTVGSNNLITWYDGGVARQTLNANGMMMVGSGVTASTSLQVVDGVNNSSTVLIGSSGNNGCLEMPDEGASKVIRWAYVSSTAWVVTSTKPTFCQ
jgi:hypothetical protein